VTELNRFDWSVEVPIQTLRQPSPAFVKYGDCGACCLAGIIGWGESSFPELYEHSLRLYPDGKKPEPHPVSWGDLLFQAGPWLHVRRLIEPVEIDPVAPDMSEWQQNLHNPYAMAPWNLEEQWVKRLRVYLRAGYVGMTTIHNSGLGPYQVRPDGERHFEGTNHWVLLTGAKQTWEEPEPGRFQPVVRVRVSCSAKGEYWIKAADLLTLYGGYWVAFIRRVPPVTPVQTLDTRP
jgi:hypothetical protein